MYKKLLVCLFCAALTANAFAVDWISGSGDWNNGSNWVGGSVPGAGATIDTYKLDSDFSAEALAAYGDGFLCTQLSPSRLGWTEQVIETYATDVFPVYSTLNMGQDRMGKTTLNIRTDMTFTSEVLMDQDGYNDPTINQYSGTLTTGSLRIPQRYRGTYNIYGGKIVAGDIRLPRQDSGWSMSNYLGDIYYDAGDGLGETTHTTLDGYYPMDLDGSYLNIYGGEVNTSTLIFNSGWNNNGVISMYEGGLLVLTGNQIDTVNTLIGQNRIVGCDGDLNVQLIEGNTHVYVPEPATMILLGIGTIGLIRRRKHC